ncbi:N-acetylmuramoyl-L-alanine amidase [Paenibacillus ginsengihumi]|uniref:N-acetylmuramoyl-L-alanine amidase n=1 Tax=Paenibacillus ginsengihumi TaxID=431596 RepID=UPI0003704488|nr:N-acetylmuramoyl-L-alanine amidase [Paenibacillus ginsengihumi]
MRYKQWLAAFIAMGLLASSSAAQAAKVVVDAGHGGYDPGAIGVYGLREKDVNLDIALKLQKILTEKGYDVVMTRDSDIYLSLKERVDIAGGQQADLFVSVHANSYGNPNTRGAMVLYYDDAYPQADYPASEAMKALTPESRELAQKVLDKFVQIVGVENRGLLPSSVYVVRMGSIPSILVETAFLSNPEDSALLADEEQRTLMAEGIAGGIEAYLPPGQAAALFPDLRGHWAQEAVERLGELGLVQGTGAGYEPDRAMTRAEWMALLERAFGFARDEAGCPEPSVSQAVYEDGVCEEPQNIADHAEAAPSAADAIPPAGAADYTDVSPDHWAFELLDQAARSGMLDGYEDGTLRPDQPVSRAEAASLFRRLALPEAEKQETAPATDMRQPFADVSADYWAAADIALLERAGWIDGVAPSRFAPDKPLTRAEAASLLDKFISRRASES